MHGAGGMDNGARRCRRRLGTDAAIELTLDSEASWRFDSQKASGANRAEKTLPSTRFERVTPGLGILCSIHLSYEGV